MLKLRDLGGQATYAGQVWQRIILRAAGCMQTISFAHNTVCFIRCGFMLVLCTPKWVQHMLYKGQGMTSLLRLMKDTPRFPWQALAAEVIRLMQVFANILGTV